MCIYHEEIFLLKIHAEAPTKERQALQLTRYYATVDQSRISKHYQRVRSPYYQSDAAASER